MLAPRVCYMLMLRACCVRAVCLPVLAACRTEVPELLGAGIRLARSQCQSRLVVAGSSPPPTRTSFILIAIPVIPVASHVPTSIICRLRFPTSIIGGPVGCPAPQVKAGNAVPMRLAGSARRSRAAVTTEASRQTNGALAQRWQGQAGSLTSAVGIDTTEP